MRVRASSSVFSLYPYVTKESMGVLWEAFHESTDLIHEGTTLITWSLPKGFHLLIPSTLGVRISRHGFWRNTNILITAIGLVILNSMHLQCLFIKGKEAEVSHFSQKSGMFGILYVGQCLC